VLKHPTPITQRKEERRMTNKIISQYPYAPKRYNDLLRTATIAVKNNEWVSLIGFQPRHSWWAK